MKRDEQVELLKAAQRAAANSYSPYSRFPVGAALRFRGGAVHTGANVENASYPVGMCAERAALFAAVGQGERELVAVAVFAEKDPLIVPCGACRQALAEFAHPPREAEVLLGSPDRFRVLSLEDLLPHAFTLPKPPEGRKAKASRGR